MIRFEDVTFGHPQKDLYNEINFSIEDGEQVAVIGSNGTGKSSLLNLILDTDRYTYEGRIIKENVGRIAYVSQFVKHEPDAVSVFEYVAKPFEALLAKADAYCKEMENADCLDDIFPKYQEVLDEIDALDAYNYSVNIKKELFVAGLSNIEELPVTSISGGEFKLLSIVKSMMLKPSLLVMDEPDVFLDLENIIGLIKLINSYEGTILAVTHNRLLLNQCFNKILHIENEELFEFPGSFKDYTISLLQNKIDMQEQYIKFDDFIQAQEVMIEKIRKVATEHCEPSTGRQLRARVSYLERLCVKRGKDPFVENRQFQIHFPYLEGEEAIEGPVLSVNNYSLSFDRQLLSDVNFEVNAGEVIAIVGANGTGKSSMLKDIYESMQNKDEIGFFKQIYDNDESKLSGGEQNLEQIKALCHKETRMLFLDEPSSHLDLYAQDALEEAINEYKGTILMVSHDFYLVTACADRVFILENGTLREMSGRAYRKSIYKKYFSAELLEQEKNRKEIEIQINALLAKGKYEDARNLIGKLE